MLAVVHILAGAAVGTLIGSWPVALIVSITLHLAFDALPHVDPGTLKPAQERGSMNMTDFVLVFLDLLVGLGILILLQRSGLLMTSVVAGVAGGVLPDLPTGIYNALPFLKQDPVFGWYYRFNRRIQGTVDKNDWLRGTVPELAVAALAVIIILLK